MDAVTLHHGDALDVLRGMADNSIDSVVTDPPYGLSDHDAGDVAEALGCWLRGEEYHHGRGGFMGRSWDEWVPGPSLWREVYRVLKPGGHLLCFAGTRTQDLMGIAIRLAGFECRDTLQWLYGSGFPKSLDVGKAIDKAAGAEREVVGEYEVTRDISGGSWSDLHGKPNHARTLALTAPATDAARQWDGWGTALKPAHEPILVFRKPLVGTVAANVQQYGTGALNIAACRVGTETIVYNNGCGGGKNKTNRMMGGNLENDAEFRSKPWSQTGRWPPNVVLSHAPGCERVGTRRVRGAMSVGRNRDGDTGTAARFFPNFEASPLDDLDAPWLYTAKASRREREAGLEGMERKQKVYNGKSDRPAGCADGSVEDKFTTQPARNHHPTVKPLSLMRWLVRLVTPPGGVVLDCFLGSGTTGMAATMEGFNFVGIEQDAEYIEIARRRIAWAQEQQPPLLRATGD